MKLHFQIRIKAKDYPSVQALHNAAQAIPEAIWQPDFKGALVSALDAVSKRIDKIDYSRYGYMESRDIEVLNAMALPIGQSATFSSSLFYPFLPTLPFPTPPPHLLN